ncbi:cell envelope integrity protein TolA, partial [Methylomonas sp. MgM2]
AKQKAEAAAKAKADAEAKQKAEAAAKAKADAEAKQKAEAAAKAKAEAEAKAKAEAEAAAAAAKAEQERQAAAKAEADKQASLAAQQAIMRKVEGAWTRPINAVQGLKCTIQVKLLPSGEVMKPVLVISSSGDDVFDRSAVNAVLKASPLPVPQDRALFNQQFRVFEFIFKPE